MRKNLDPRSLHTDEEIYAALQKLGLLRKVQSMSEGLDTFLNQNFLSSSEKQTFCLARAILKKYFILSDQISEKNRTSGFKVKI